MAVRGVGAVAWAAAACGLAAAATAGPCPKGSTATANVIFFDQATGSYVKCDDGWCTDGTIFTDFADLCSRALDDALLKWTMVSWTGGRQCLRAPGYSYWLEGRDMVLYKAGERIADVGRCSDAELPTIQTDLQLCTCGIYQASSSTAAAPTSTTATQTTVATTTATSRPSSTALPTATTTSLGVCPKGNAETSNVVFFNRKTGGHVKCDGFWCTDGTAFRTFADICSRALSETQLDWDLVSWKGGAQCVHGPGYSYWSEGQRVALYKGKDHVAVVGSCEGRELSSIFKDVHLCRCGAAQVEVPTPQPAAKTTAPTTATTTRHAPATTAQVASTTRRPPSTAAPALCPKGNTATNNVVFVHPLTGTHVECQAGHCTDGATFRHFAEVCRRALEQLGWDLVSWRGGARCFRAPSYRYQPLGSETVLFRNTERLFGVGNCTGAELASILGDEELCRCGAGDSTVGSGLVGSESMPPFDFMPQWAPQRLFTAARSLELPGGHALSLRAVAASAMFLPLAAAAMAVRRRAASGRAARDYALLASEEEAMGQEASDSEGPEATPLLAV